MRRLLAALMSAMLLAAMIPGVAAAGPSVRFEEHHVGFFCDIAFDGGFASAHIDTNNVFGDFGGAEAWLDPAVPFEEPPSMSGGSEVVQKSEGADQVDLSVAFTVFDAEDNELGEGVIEATLTPDGPPVPINDDFPGNRKSVVQGTFQPMAVTGTLTLPGLELALANCFGDVTDVSVFETNPTAFVNSNEGIFVDCFWETPDATAFLFVTEDSFGAFGDAFLGTADQNLFTTGSTASVSTSAMTASISMSNEAGDPFSAEASASLTPSGGLVTSNILSTTSKEKLVEQTLIPNGELAFSTGDTFVIDESNCRSIAFDSHVSVSGPAGPKAGGRVPANDGPDGAIELSSGARLNVQTGGTQIEPEVPITTCPDGEFDAMGHTLWYTVEGTGGQISIDTAGSNIDTVLAVYQPDGDGFVEVACIDDVFGDPIGITFQAALTIDTVEGETYYVQVGGFDARFQGGNVEFGRLRLRID